MADDEQSTDNPKPSGPKPLGGELILPISGLLFTIYYFTTIIDVPWTAQVSAFFVGSILIALIASPSSFGPGLSVKTGRSDVRSRAAFRAESIHTKTSRPSRSYPRLYFLYPVGRVYNHDLLFSCSLRCFCSATGRRKALSFGISLALSIGGYLLFILAFNTRFPRGPVETLLKDVF